MTTTTRARTKTRAPRRRVVVARVVAVVAVALCALATGARAARVLVDDDGRSGARRADVEVRARDRASDAEGAIATTTTREAIDVDDATEGEGDDDEDAVETVDDEAPTTAKTTTTATMPTVEDVDTEDADDSITEGAGAEEVRSADATFESEAVAEKKPKPSAVARAGADEADEADEEEIEEGVYTREGDEEEDEEDEEELSEEEALAIIEKGMKVRLKALYGEPTEKQKKWVSKVKEVHQPRRRGELYRGRRHVWLHGRARRFYDLASRARVGSRRHRDVRRRQGGRVQLSALSLVSSRQGFETRRGVRFRVQGYG